MANDTSWMLTEPRSGGANAAPYMARFESIGVKLPERRLTSTDLIASLRHPTDIDIERLTGIRERRVCSEGEDSYSLAVDAARDCLARSAVRAADLEMVICTSITRYKDGLSFRYEPPLSGAIKEAIGAHTAIAFDLNNACAGMLTGVFLLNEYVRRGVIRRGMVVSGEYISSLGTNAARDVRSIMSSQLASLTLGDSGAAVIVERAPEGKPGIMLAAFTTISEHSRLCLGHPAPDSPGAQMFTKARTIHKVAIEDFPPLLEEVLANSNLSFADIDWLIPHQTSARAIRAAERRLSERNAGGPRNVVVNVEDYGNTSSTTHFLALHRYLTERRFQPGEKVLLLALASGLEIGVIVLVMDELLESHGHTH